MTRQTIPSPCVDSSYQPAFSVRSLFTQTLNVCFAFCMFFPPRFWTVYLHLKARKCSDPPCGGQVSLTAQHYLKLSTNFRAKATNSSRKPRLSPVERRS